MLDMNHQRRSLGSSGVESEDGKLRVWQTIRR
jgi:hypothetical protein